MNVKQGLLEKRPEGRYYMSHNGGWIDAGTDARLIAATNRGLAAMLEQQKFRSDLFYRLNVFPLRVPPLRERLEDIPLLARHFVQALARRMNKRIETIPSETLSILSEYQWPGNIRELQNVIERAVIVSSGPVLRLLDRTLPGPSRRTEGQAQSDTTGNLQRILEAAERRQILAALDEWVGRRRAQGCRDTSGHEAVHTSGANAKAGYRSAAIKTLLRQLDRTGG